MLERGSFITLRCDDEGRGGPPDMSVKFYQDCLPSPLVFAAEVQNET